MNQFQPFARLPQAAAAKAGGPRSSSLTGSPATSINHPQQGSTRGQGRGTPYELGNLFSHASIRADGRYGRALLTRQALDRKSSLLTWSRKTGGGFGSRTFPIPLAGGRDCNRALAKITSARSHFQCVSERHQRHFNSRLSSPVRDARTKQRKASHCAGQKPQGYGNV